VIVKREGEGKPLEFDLIRARIQMESVVGVKRNADDSWDFLLGPARKIAYVRLTGFTEKTATDLSAALTMLKGQGVAGLILDLRFNSGGLLNTCIEVADLFVAEGLLVSTHPRNGQPQRYEAKKEGTYLDFPIVCLVNDTSASASEIVAACLQDHKRALILGERTYGKGSVQTMKDFEGGQIGLTTSLFHRPNGKGIDKHDKAGRDADDWGVVPDRILNLTARERNDLCDYLFHVQVIPRPDRRAEHARREFRDRQRDMALEYLRETVGGR